MAEKPSSRQRGSLVRNWEKAGQRQWDREEESRELQEKCANKEYKIALIDEELYTFTGKREARDWKLHVSLIYWD